MKFYGLHQDSQCYFGGKSSLPVILLLIKQKPIFSLKMLGCSNGNEKGVE